MKKILIAALLVVCFSYLAHINNNIFQKRIFIAGIVSNEISCSQLNKLFIDSLKRVSMSDLEQFFEIFGYNLLKQLIKKSIKKLKNLSLTFLYNPTKIFNPTLFKVFFISLVISLPLVIKSFTPFKLIPLVLRC